MIGEKIWTYRIEALLAEKTTATVYRARSEMSSGIVAVKAIRPELVRTACRLLTRSEWNGPGEEPWSIVARELTRETEALIWFDHPNMERIREVFVREDALVFVTELVEGKPLDAVLREGGRIPTDTALQYCCQVLAALESAHAKTAVPHNDIRPANIILLPAGGVKVVDYGVAQMIGGQGLAPFETLLTDPLPYASPEAILGDRDHRADLYAVGVTLYELLTGKLPFSGETWRDLAGAILYQTPVAPSAHDPGLPLEVQAIIVTAMEKEPARRFQTAGEFLRAIWDYWHLPA